MIALLTWGTASAAGGCGWRKVGGFHCGCRLHGGRVLTNVLSSPCTKQRFMHKVYTETVLGDIQVSEYPKNA